MCGTGAMQERRRREEKRTAQLRKKFPRAGVRRVVVVGDSGVGKTALVRAFAGQPPSPASRGEESLAQTTDVNVLIDDGAPVQLSLRDTVNGGIAPLASRETVDAALLCFSIASPESLRSVRERWAEEAEYWYGRRVRIIVVGCQRDLRDDAATVAALDAGGEGSEARTVTYDEGAAVAESIEADAYVECASNRSDDVGKALLEIARAII